MASRTGQNRLSGSETASFVDEFERFEKEIEAEKSAFMLKCKAIRAKQKDLLEDAKGKGALKQVIKDAAKIRKKYREIEELMREQEDDAEEDLDAVLKALGGLGDLPLGQAVVEKVSAKDKKDADDRERTDAVIDAVRKDEAKKKGGKKDAASDDEAWKQAAPAGSA